ncbi:MAG TPA: phosphomannomutase/phosphoglucomutase, partial [Spirochaetia bacterium]|nr:phosphomannomutase/phosphoglucomutase [Spirochaetia bacterium]
EAGRSVESYFIAVLIGEQLLKEHPGSAIVYDLISSRVLPEEIERMGGRPIVSRVGYTFLHETMVKSKAVFGSETSGHAYFRVSDDYYTESAAYALIMLLKTLRGRAETLSELVAPLRERYAQAPEMNLEVEDKDRALRLIEEQFSGGRVSRLDGISIEFEDFWFNARPSNTEPVLRLRLEARTQDTALRRIEEIIRLVQNR